MTFRMIALAGIAWCLSSALADADWSQAAVALAWAAGLVREG